MYDSRVVQRYIGKGQVTPAEHEAYLKALPDETANAEWVSYDMEETEIPDVDLDDEEDEEETDSADEGAEEAGTESEPDEDEAGP